PRSRYQPTIMPDALTLIARCSQTEKGRAQSTAFFIWCRRYLVPKKFRWPVLSRAGPGEIRLAGGAQIVGRRLARATIGYDLVADLLAFAQRSKSGAFEGADVNEHVVATVIRLNEAEALGCVKPLHGP